MLSLLKYLMFSKRKIPDTKFDFLLLCHDNDRGYHLNGLPYSQIIDTFRDEAINKKFKTITIAKPFSKLTGNNTYGRPYSINTSYFRAKIKERLGIIYSKFNPRYDYYNWIMVEYWEDILKKVKPRCIVGIQPSAELCVAAKRQGILTCDIQHGVVQPGGYYNDRQSCRHGKDGIPDVVFCWDQESAYKVRLHWPYVTTLVTGNPWLRRFLDPFNDRLAVKELNAVNTKINGNARQRLILLTTQYDLESNGQVHVPEKIIEAIRKTHDKGLRWCIKFHPVELKIYGHKNLRNAAKRLMGEDLLNEMIDLSEHPLPAIFHFVGFHITGYSASAIEAIPFGVKSGLWDTRPVIKNWFKSYLSSGWIRLLPEEPFDIAEELMFQAANPIDSGIDVSWSYSIGEFIETFST